MGMFSRKKADEWLDWLADEQPADDVQAEMRSKKAYKKQLSRPEPTVIRPASAAPVGITDRERRERLRRAGMHAPHAAQQTTKPTPQAAISININLPKLRLPKVVADRLKWLKRPTWQQTRYWGAFSIGVIVLAVGARALLGILPGQSGEKKDVQGATTTVRAQPSFKPLAPEKKPELGTAGSGKSQYDGKRDLYTFSDNFSGANILVSQQPMPEMLKKDPAKVLQLTDSIGAKEKVTTAYGVAYFGVDEKSKVLRSVLLNTNQSRLIFMQSDKAFDAETIKFYFESLR